ncbi:MAG: CDP-alcohol phosphatidyltransferase family protein, partial [Clostridia bacterium]|nr:CDP-alcohol phosphatidyltransferase family protein [Clostridia bacterium]
MRRTLKQEVFTLPNILSFIRLFMIPLIVWIYTVKQRYILTLILVGVSAVTDVIDGKIARKYNLISEIGKVLDPVADKLTQFALIVCLSTRYEKMLYLAATLFLREMLMILFGFIAAKKKRSMFNSKWFGKLATVTVYLSVIALLVFPDMPLNAVNTIMIIAETVILLSMVLYVIMFVSFIINPDHRAIDGPDG